MASRKRSLSGVRHPLLTCRVRDVRRCSRTRSSVSCPPPAPMARILAAIPALQGAGANPALDTNNEPSSPRTADQSTRGACSWLASASGTAMQRRRRTSNAIDTANAPRSRFRSRVGSGRPRSGTISTSFRTGGNAFQGSAFGSGAGTWSQANNLDSELRAFGISEPAALIKPGTSASRSGGPIRRDRLWFFGNVRDFGNHTGIPGLYANRYAGDAAHWDYVPIRPQGSHGDVENHRLDAPDDAGDAAQQVRLLLRLPVDLRQASLSTTGGCRPARRGLGAWDHLRGPTPPRPGPTTRTGATSSPGHLVAPAPTSCCSKQGIPRMSTTGAGCRSPAPSRTSSR